MYICVRYRDRQKFRRVSSGVQEQIMRAFLKTFRDADVIHLMGLRDVDRYINMAGSGKPAHVGLVVCS